MRKQEAAGGIELVYGSLDSPDSAHLALGPTHGHAIAKSIERMSEETLKLEHGSLYPALPRLQQEGWIAAQWAYPRTTNGLSMPADSGRTTTT